MENNFDIELEIVSQSEPIELKISETTKIVNENGETAGGLTEEEIKLLIRQETTNLQPKEDNELHTTSKRIVGAINETFGKSIASVRQTVTSTEDNGENIVTVTLKDGSTYTFSVFNGSKGSQGETPPVYILTGKIRNSINGECEVEVYKDGVLYEQQLYLDVQVASGTEDWRKHNTSTGGIKGKKSWTFGGNVNGIAWKADLYTDSTRLKLLASCIMNSAAKGDNGYTPVKGIDYWTDADKTEIIEQAKVGAIGDIETAIDRIIEIQNSLIGGGTQ